LESRQTLKVPLLVKLFDFALVLEGGEGIWWEPNASRNMSERSAGRPYNSASIFSRRGNRAVKPNASRLKWKAATLKGRKLSFSKKNPSRLDAMWSSTKKGCRFLIALTMRVRNSTTMNPPRARVR
jgi:hypothetical protein